MFSIPNPSCHLCLQAVQAVGEQETNNLKHKPLSGHGMDVLGEQVGDLTESSFDALAHRLEHKLFAQG